MEKWNRFLGRRSRRERIFDEFNAVKKAPIWGFFVLIAVYIVGIIFVNKTSASDGVFILSGQAISHRSITGAISSVCNLCLVMLVVLYKRPGFYVSILALLSAFPSLIIRIIHHNIFYFTKLLCICKRASPKLCHNDGHSMLSPLFFPLVFKRYLRLQK